MARTVTASMTRTATALGSATSAVARTKAAVPATAWSSSCAARAGTTRPQQQKSNGSSACLSKSQSHRQSPSRQSPGQSCTGGTPKTSSSLASPASNTGRSSLMAPAGPLVSQIRQGRSSTSKRSRPVLAPSSSLKAKKPATLPPNSSPAWWPQRGHQDARPTAKPASTP